MSSSVRRLSPPRRIRRTSSSLRAPPSQNTSTCGDVRRPLDGDDNLADQGPQELLAIAVAGALRSPDLGQVTGQAGECSAFLIAQRRGPGMLERGERSLLTLGEWTKLFPDPRLAKAVVDRLTHRAHIIDTGKESWRFHHGLNRPTPEPHDEQPGNPAANNTAIASVPRTLTLAPTGLPSSPRTWLSRNSNDTNQSEKQSQRQRPRASFDRPQQASTTPATTSIRHHQPDDNQREGGASSGRRGGASASRRAQWATS